MVSWLIEHGATLQSTTKWNGDDLMVEAVERGYTGIVRVLAHAGVELEKCRNWEGKSLLQVAVSRGHQHTGLTLLELVFRKDKRFTLADGKRREYFWPTMAHSVKWTGENT